MTFRPATKALLPSALDLDAREFVVRSHVGEDDGVPRFEAGKHLNGRGACPAELHVDAIRFFSIVR